MEAPARPAFGRTKHELIPEEAELDAFPNDRYHYNLFGFLQRRRGGGGGSRASGGSSSGSSSPSRGSSGSSSSGKSRRWLPVSKPASPQSPWSPSGSHLSSGVGGLHKPSAVGSDSFLGSSSSLSSKPSAPKSASSTGGSSPSKPKSPVSAPPKTPKTPKAPKAPNLPKLPKPKSGWEPPKGSLPGYKPGHPNHHGSGWHVPVIGGGQNHDHDRAPSVRSCIHPKGLDRLRCDKGDAVVVTIFAIIGLLLAPLLIYLCIMYCKRRKGARRNRNEEDGMELTHGVMHCDPGLQTDREVSDGTSNIGLHIGTSQESLALTKEQTQDRSLDFSPGRKPPPAYQPSIRSMSRGRKLIRAERPGRSITSSFSSGMIRVAMLGHSQKDPTVIDVLPSLAGSKRKCERKCSGSDVDRSSDCNPRLDGKRRCSKNRGRDCVDNGEDGDRHEEAERRRGSSKRKSVSEQQNEEESRPDDAGSRRSSRRSKSRAPSDQPDNDVDPPNDTASRYSVSRPSPPTSRPLEGDGETTAGS